MRILHQVLKKIYQDYAVFFPPAKLSEIQKVNFELSQTGLASLPQDYIDFLNNLIYTQIAYLSSKNRQIIYI